MPPPDEETTQTPEEIASDEAAAKAAASKPDPITEAVNAARRAAEEAVKISRANMAAADQDRRSRAMVQPPPPREEKEEDDDTDPSIAAAIERRVDKKLKAVMAGIDQVYTGHRTQDLSYRAEQERRESERSLPSYSDYSSDVDDYMRDLPLDLRSQPGAYREAYYVVRGRRAAEQDALKARQAPAISTETRSTTLDLPSPKITKEDALAARDLFGVNLDEKDDILMGNAVSIETFRARRAVAK